MQLPGGLLRAGARRRDVELEVPSGDLELGVTGARAPSLPARVSEALLAGLARVAGEVPSRAVVDELCVADRQFLMHRMAELLDLDEPWLSAPCESCAVRFDFPVNLAALPVRPAGDTFPFAEVATSVGRIRARVPTGADQDAIWALPAAAAERTLLARCVEGVDVERLTDVDIALVEAAIEEVSPAIVTCLGASCPECGHEHTLALDPYLVLDATPARTLDEVHTIACAYHWSERDILALPRERRRSYLARIDRMRGMVS